MKKSKDEGRTGFEKYISIWISVIYFLLLLSLRITFGALFSNIYIILITVLVLLLLTSLTLISRRHAIVRTWYKGKFKKQIWFWIFGFSILLIYIVLTWFLTYGIALLFDLYLEHIV